MHQGHVKVVAIVGIPPPSGHPTSDIRCLAIDFSQKGTT
jgi:hypothetical protein